MTITIQATLTGRLGDAAAYVVDIEDVRANVYDGMTLMGYSDTVTQDGRMIEFQPSGEYLTTRLYQVELAKKSDGEVLTEPESVWIKTASGTFISGDPNELAGFQAYKNTTSEIIGTSYEIVVKDQDEIPVDNCACWVTTDEAGTNIVSDRLETDSYGRVWFILRPGSYYLFRVKSGITFATNPRSFTVA